MILAFDIGGTTIKPGYVHGPDAIVPLTPVATPAHDLEAFLESIEKVILDAPKRPEVIAISICAVTDVATGATICANIPAIDGIALVGTLEQKLGLPVALANDADCFALAEARLGAGRGHDVVFGIILGTGVGGGLVVGGALANRDGGFAGEWGHGAIVQTQVGDPPRPIAPLACGCGRTGCIDTIGGARGIERLHHVLWGEAIDSRTLLAHWHAGAPDACRTVAAWLELVANPLALLVNVTGATAVPVGGGLSRDNALVAALDEAVRARILRRTTEPLVVPAECAVEPGLVGAAALGLTRMEKAQ